LLKGSPYAFAVFLQEQSLAECCLPSRLKFLTPDEMVDRCAKGLCYNCGEKFLSGHRCKKLFRIVLDYPDDGGRYESGVGT